MDDVSFSAGDITALEQPRLELRKHSGVQPWRLHLVGLNGEQLAISEGYYSKWNAKRAARKNFPAYVLEDKT